MDWTCTEQIVSITEHYWKFWTDSEHYWKFWTDSEHSEHGLNIILTLLNILSTDWTCTEQILSITEHYWNFWTDSEHSEHGLNRFWTFWTWTEQILNITEHYWKFWTDSFLIKCFIFYIKSIYFTSLALDFN